MEREKEAWAARERGSSQPTYPDDVYDEFKAALVCVSASAHALDALYGVTKDLLGKDAGARPRQANILETFKLGFQIGSRAHGWVAEFAWLFDLRDSAVHFKETPHVAERHPVGPHVAKELVTYSRSRPQGP